MNFPILLALCSLSLAATTRIGDLTPLFNRTTRTLQDDLNDFLELIPVRDMESLFLDYLANDTEMQNLMTYLQSDEFVGMLVNVLSLPDVKDLLKYLASAGLDVGTWLNNFLSSIGGDLPPIIITKHGRTVAEFWNQIKAMLPIDELKALYVKKLECSPEFKALIDQITSDEFHNMVITVKALPEVTALRQGMLEYGIDVEAIERFVRDLFGW